MYKIKHFFKDKDFILRMENKVVHFKLSKWIQFFFVIVIFIFLSFFTYLSAFKINYSKNINELSLNLKNSENKMNSFSLDFESYRLAFDEINKNIESLYKNVYSESHNNEIENNVILNDVKSLKSRFKNLDELFNKKIINNEKDDEEIELRLAKIGRDLAINELKETKSRVEILEKSLKDNQKIQIKVFEKLSSMVDDEANAIEEKMTKIKNIMKNTGYSFQRLYSKTKEEIFSQGGPFIPVTSNAIKEVPELENKNFEDASTSLYKRIDNWNTLKLIESKLPLGRPIKTIQISAPFGNRFDPFNGEISLHEGIDLAEKEGVEVKITSPGKVTYSGRMGFYGIMIEVDHGNKVKTRYAHLKRALVKKGDFVEKGDTIGEVGNTGRSTGAHLHYEVRLNGYPVNPYQFIKVRKDVFKE